MKTTDIQTLMDYRIWHVWYHFIAWSSGGEEISREAALYADQAKITQFHQERGLS